MNSNSGSIRRKRITKGQILVFLTVAFISSGILATVLLVTVAYSSDPRDIFATAGRSLFGQHGRYWQEWANRQGFTAAASANHLSAAEDTIVHVDAEQIGRDLHRLGTQDPVEIGKIERVLHRAVAKYPETGYAQGMGFLAATVVKHVGADKGVEVLFSVFDALFTHVKPIVCLLPQEPILQARKDVEQIIRTLSPEFPTDDPAVSDFVSMFVFSTLPSAFASKFSRHHVGLIWSVAMAAQECLGIGVQEYFVLLTAVMISTSSSSTFLQNDRSPAQFWNQSVPRALARTNCLIKEIQDGKYPSLVVFTSSTSTSTSTAASTASRQCCIKNH